MAEVTVELRERLRNDQAFRSRFMDEVLLQLAGEMGLIDEDGTFKDPNSSLQPSAVDARVAGRPVIHYYGLNKQQIKGMGLSAKEQQELSKYMSIEDDPNAIEDPTAATSGIRMHPGAVLWTPPPALSPEEASVQNPSGQVAIESAKTPLATHPLAVFGQENSTETVPEEQVPSTKVEDTPPAKTETAAKTDKKD